MIYYGNYYGYEYDRLGCGYQVYGDYGYDCCCYGDYGYDCYCPSYYGRYWSQRFYW
uniref:Uncharacterized protein n=1 Tax=Capra hircus TaxID=9925 RepID=A0A8C2NMX3_CAPHI